MNIKVITRHTPCNYGSLLQSIATISAIESLGHTCQIIDYWKRNEMGFEAVRTVLNSKPTWKKNWFRRFLYIALRYPGEWLAAKRFSKMRAKYLKLSQRCYTSDELAKLDADVFMTGSDQVWGPLLDGKYDANYFLDFVKNGKPKVAYAGSFGRTEFSSDIIANYKRMLSSYKALTVRESSAVKMLSEWNIPCKGQVLDPTLLLDASQWNKYIDKPIEGDYVLIYEIHNNPKLDDYANRFAKHVNLPLVRISPYIQQFSRVGKMVFCPKLGTFLSYIKNAKFMITDSFHGTAFAINLNTQFMEVLPNNKTGARNQSILQLTNLQNRIVTDLDDFSFVNKPINFDAVNAIIREERKASLNLLEHIINTSIQ